MLAGCAEWPELTVPNEGTSAAAGWPSLVPLAPILAREAAPITVAAQPADRIAALNARAAALRGRAVIDRATRARMQSGVSAAARAALN